MQEMSLGNSDKKRESVGVSASEVRDDSVWVSVSNRRARWHAMIGVRLPDVAMCRDNGKWAHHQEGGRI